MLTARDELTSSPVLLGRLHLGGYQPACSTEYLSVITAMKSQIILQLPEILGSVLHFSDGHHLALGRVLINPIL
jgi:hypothetical protein